MPGKKDGMRLTGSCPSGSSVVLRLAVSIPVQARILIQVSIPETVAPCKAIAELG